MNNEEFTIQCENCGTLYSDLEDVCPYCGQPQPLLEALEEVEEEHYISEEAQEDTHIYDIEEMPAEEQFTDEDIFAVEGEEGEHFADEDIFAVVGEEADQLQNEDFANEDIGNEEIEDFANDEYYPDNEEDEELQQDYEEHEELYEHYDDEDEEEYQEELEPTPKKRRLPIFTKQRIATGCLTIFICAGIFIGIGIKATYDGLQERAVDIEVEAENHYQRGQAYFTEGQIELAIAEFERTVSLNPNHTLAQEALREVQTISYIRPTPTSKTRSDAVASILAEAETQASEENWFEAVNSLSQVRGINPDYETERVSELLYTANYQLGLQLLTPERIDEAMLSFERALAERPDDAQATAEMNKVSLYVAGNNAYEQNELTQAIQSFKELYDQDSNYIDVSQRLPELHKQFGDELANNEDWCQAEIHYNEVLLIKSERAVEVKAAKSKALCLN